jgi:hypothetical protein
MTADLDAPAPRSMYSRVKSRIPARVRRWLWRFVLAVAGLVFVDLVWAVADATHTPRVADMLLGYIVRGAAAVGAGIGL